MLSTILEAYNQRPIRSMWVYIAGKAFLKKELVKFASWCIVYNIGIANSNSNKTDLEVQISLLLVPVYILLDTNTK